MCAAVPVGISCPLRFGVFFALNILVRSSRTPRKRVTVQRTSSSFVESEKH